MFRTIKLGGLWQIWNVTCDGSIIVENGHRNTAFFNEHHGKKAKTLVNALKALKPAFSLSLNLSRVSLDSDLQQDPRGFHVFDYTQFQESNIQIGDYVHVVDFRPGSLVVFKGSIFTGGRVLDELDTFPGIPFLVRSLKDGDPEAIAASKISEIHIPHPNEAENYLLERARQSWELDHSNLDQDELEAKRLEWDKFDGEFPGKFSSFDDYLKNSNLKEHIDDYISAYCYPDIALKIPTLKD